jgi:hypothetical protein
MRILVLVAVKNDYELPSKTSTLHFFEPQWEGRMNDGGIHPSFVHQNDCWVYDPLCAQFPNDFVRVSL